MSASNNRVREYDTVHHLMNRIAHKVYILNEDDRNDFLTIIFRAADFVGIKLLGWCIMTNHFHLLAYLPTPIELDETEIFRRYGVLKGVEAKIAKEQEIEKLRANGGGAEADAWFKAQRKRMYDVGSFMKIAKQWFTEDYNRRYSHIGTLWEGEYIDKSVKLTMNNMARCLAYIHLNPIRAALTDSYDGYLWSSFSAFRRGDKTAIEGLRFIYEDEEQQCSTEELGSAQELLMDELLEYEKRRRAEEIARRRMAGQEAPCDQLTNEALVIQAAAHLEEVRRAGAASWENRSNQFSQIELKIVTLMFLDPSVDIIAICKEINCSRASVYRVVEKLKRRGVIERGKLGWVVNSENSGLTCFLKRVD